MKDQRTLFDLTQDGTQKTGKPFELATVRRFTTKAAPQSIIGKWNTK